MNSRKIEQRIKFAAIAPYIAYIREWSVFTPLIPLTTVGVLWHQVDRALLMGWFTLMLSGIFFRYLLSSGFHQQTVQYQEGGTWRLRLLAISAYLSTLWCLAILFFFIETSAPHQVFLITIAVTLGIGSISSGMHWLPLYYVYGIPILVALTVRLAMVGTPPYLALSLMMVCALLAAYSFAKKLNGMVRSEMRMRYESEALTRKLRFKTEEAEKAVCAKSRVLAAASHDLRQPLHALSLFIDALRESRSPAEDTRLFKRIDLSMAAMRHLFDALFDMSRLDANVVQPEFRHFDIAHCLTNLQEEYQPEAEKKQLRLRLHVRSHIVVSDPILLDRILRNIIGNAVRYTHSGGVLISARRREKAILVQVWDTGTGIPPESHEKVFLEFQRLQRDSDETRKGIGLGLAIVRRLCNLLGYPLKLRSSVGTGSVFSIEVPEGSTSLVTPQNRGNRHMEWHHTESLLLVIDDDWAILSAMNTLLSNWGFKVLVAESLAQCEEQLQATGLKPDLILSDLNLTGPDNGIDILHRLQDQYGEDIPGILISGSTDLTLLNLASKSGLRLIQKPVHPLELRSIIQHQLVKKTASAR